MNWVKIITVGRVLLLTLAPNAEANHQKKELEKRRKRWVDTFSRRFARILAKKGRNY